MRKVLHLPSGRGRLLIATDLQGNLRDLRAMAARFQRALAEEPETHLLFAGDLVHGPMLALSEWQPWLGEFYVDASILVFEELTALMAAYPGRVHALLGNHEHGHVGGFRTAKFFLDEVDALESRMTRDTVGRFRRFCRSLPLVAVSAEAGVIVTHAAPAAQITGPDDLEALSYDVARGLEPSIEAALGIPVLGPLLWARHCPADTARGFIRALLGRDTGFVAYGHDVVPEGWQIFGDGEQICVSTSFGCFDYKKAYLDLDLSRRYESALDLREGVEIQRLFPDAVAEEPRDRSARRRLLHTL
ncbi:MAG: metallophosphoesterase [Myxococcales bacterium]|nr:metallophosphoesterase [Myxococcales bacterium]MCB9735761.1 metallophosphoesterase [Deltaproteobacteria bacterium]